MIAAETPRPLNVLSLFNGISCARIALQRAGNGKRLVSESQQYKALGNGWVVDVIAHIFSFIKQPNA